MRNTWTNQSFKEHKLIRNIFLVGRSLNKSVNDQLVIESETYGDILQVDFIDSYKRLIDKTIYGLKWMSEYCENAKFIMKVDDDMVVNTKSLIEYFTSLSNYNSTNKMYGRCKHPYNIPIRDIKDKHYISREDYAPDLWPNYCLGPAYILTSDTLKPLYNLTKFVKQFPMEDVYVGLLASHLKIDLVDIEYMWVHFKKEFFKSPIQYNKDFKSKFLKLSNRIINNKNFLFFMIDRFDYFYLIWDLLIPK